MGAHKELFTEWLDKWAAPEVKELPTLGQQLEFAKWYKEKIEHHRWVRKERDERRQEPNIGFPAYGDDI